MIAQMVQRRFEGSQNLDSTTGTLEGDEFFDAGMPRELSALCYWLPWVLVSCSTSVMLQPQIAVSGGPSCFVLHVALHRMQPPVHAIAYQPTMHAHEQQYERQLRKHVLS